MIIISQLSNFRVYISILTPLIEFDGTITEKLKAKNQMLWIQKVNTCKNIAEEIVLREIVYGDEI